MIWAGREVRSRTDYTLGTDRRFFWNVSVRDLRHNSDHLLVLGCLHSSPLMEHSRYLRGHKKPPLQPPTAPTREDGIFVALRRAFLNPRARDARKNAWILEATWRLVDERVSTRQDIVKYQSLIWRLVHVIAASFKRDRQRQAEESGADMEALLGSDTALNREAWHHIKGWYQATVNRAPPPARVTLERITAERVELYSYNPPLGANIPISMEPLPVDDSVPTGDKIKWAVKRLKNHRSGGPSGMRTIN